MPDQPSQSLIDALLGHFRAKGQDMANKPMWGETQWRGPGGYIPFPQKDSHVAEMGMTALMAPMAIKGGGVHEWPTSAAIKYGDNAVFTGQNHALALMKADLSKIPASVSGEAGFVTNTGRFVDRIEAQRLAKFAGKTKYTTPSARPSSSRRTIPPPWEDGTPRRRRRR